MDKNWERRILEVSKRSTPEEEAEFLSLVDGAFHHCDLYTARVLMKTFSARPDYGTQERVISALSTAQDEIVIRALLEELPRLSREAPEWAVTLIGTEVEFRPDILQRVVLSMSEEVKNALKSIVSEPDFKDFYKNAELVQII